MNTRLQVEHPVTEEVTGLDLVRLQLQVASGEPLGFTQDDVTVNGHAIEVRLYAEEPARDFAPAPGPVHRYVHPDGPHPDAYVRGKGCPSNRFREHSDIPIRWEDGIGSSAEISPFYDPMIAKVIAHGATRTEAALRLSRALAATEVHGTATNLVFLAAALSHDDFLAGETRTDFIDRHPELLTAQPPTPGHVHLAAGIAVTVARRRAADQLTRLAPPGSATATMRRLVAAGLPPGTRLGDP
jgi:3-methylcrotonyl-CoA carboxylase alpha subunit